MSVLAHEDNPKSIKYYVKRYILANQANLKGKTVVDIPAGSGVTTRILSEVGAKVEAYDLFPEYFTQTDIKCTRADLMQGLKIDSQYADVVFCQEGLEHFSDPAFAFREFSRILKPGGILVLTTPNYSSISSRLSYLFFESENHKRQMPPNELDSIWMSTENETRGVYFGHAFLIGIQRVRLFATLAGFDIKKILRTRSKGSAIIGFVFLYPLILFRSWLTYKKNMRRQKKIPFELRKKIYSELFRLNIKPGILLDGHLFIEFIKSADAPTVFQNLRRQHESFSVET